MDGFTIRNANKFLETGKMLGESNSLSSPRNNIPGGGADETQKSFAATLSEAIQSVNKLQTESNTAIQNLATGRTDNVAEVMVASEKADIALRLMMQVRNKIIDAYQEIMKMQV